MSATVSAPSTATAAPSSVNVGVEPDRLMTGASLIGLIVIEIVPRFESTMPSFTLNVNESGPLTSGSGVYVTDAVQLPTAEQSGALSGPSEPPVGPSTMVNVSATSSASVPVSVITSAASSSVATLAPTATGVAFGGTIVMSNVWVALVLSPPFAVPPSSVSTTLTVALPLVASAAV